MPRQMDGWTEKHNVIAVTLCLRFAVRVNEKSLAVRFESYKLQTVLFQPAIHLRCHVVILNPKMKVDKLSDKLMC